MRNKVNLIILVILLLSSLFSCRVDAQTAKEFGIVFVNGIQNTRAGAIQSAQKVKAIGSESVNHQGSELRSFTSVQLIYNPNGWYGNILPRPDPIGLPTFSLTQDLTELFLQKSSEEDNSWRISNIIVPFNQAPNININAASEIATSLSKLMPGTTSLEKLSSIDARRMASTGKAINDLTAYLRANTNIIVVAHSQGNLLANVSYAQIASEFGNNIANKVRIINVANTSEFSINKLNFTTSFDAALYKSASIFTKADRSLETLPSRYDWSRKSLACWSGASYCTDNFKLAAPTMGTPTTAIPFELSLDGFANLFLKHLLVNTYLSDAVVPVIPDAIDKGVKFTPGAERFRDRMEDFIYAAAYSFETPLVTASFAEEFNDTAVDVTKWNLYGGVTESAGYGSFPAYGYLDTKGKVTFQGSRIVIEARIAQQGSLALFDNATNEAIYFGNVAYADWGFYANGSGAYNFVEVERPGGVGPAPQNCTALGGYTDVFMEYRITIDGNKITMERGPTLANITQSATRTLGQSIVGKSFYLLAGTGDTYYLSHPRRLEGLVMNRLGFKSYQSFMDCQGVFDFSAD